jgi:hypothetical protein
MYTEHQADGMVMKNSVKDETHPQKHALRKDHMPCNAALLTATAALWHSLLLWGLIVDHACMKQPTWSQQRFTVRSLRLFLLMPRMLSASIAAPGLAKGALAFCTDAM